MSTCIHWQHLLHLHFTLCLLLYISPIIIHNDTPKAANLVEEYHRTCDVRSRNHCYKQGKFVLRTLSRFYDWVLVKFRSAISTCRPKRVPGRLLAAQMVSLWCCSKRTYTDETRDQDLSHITAGYLYNSPSQKKVRADEAYQLNLASSLFDFANTTSDGLVSNTLSTWSPSVATERQTFSGYVNPIFPLFESNTLVTSAAVFSGLVERPMHGKVAAVSARLWMHWTSWTICSGVSCIRVSFQRLFLLTTAT